MEGFVSTKDAADRLKVSTTRVREMITDGVLEAQKFGRDWFIPEKEVARLESSERKPGRPPKQSK